MSQQRRTVDPALPCPVTLACVKGVGFQLHMREDRPLTQQESVLVRALLQEKMGHCHVFCGPEWEHGCDNRCGQSEICALAPLDTDNN